MYLAWASFYEGESDRSYYDVFLPRLMEDILLVDGVREVNIPATPAIQLGKAGRSVENVAEEICRHRDAYHIVFIHADTGGRNLEMSLSNRGSAYCEAIRLRCGWQPDRCVLITPRHETEAWVLADSSAVAEALGYRGSLADLNLPSGARMAEQSSDPKALLSAAARTLRGRRSRPVDGSQLFASIAQSQSISVMRQSRSFMEFENRLRSALASLGCI